MDFKIKSVNKEWTYYWIKVDVVGGDERVKKIECSIDSLSLLQDESRLKAVLVNEYNNRVSALNREIEEKQTFKTLKGKVIDP
jgi:hypothetical protein